MVQTFEESINQNIQITPLDEMASVFPEDSGLKFKLWCSCDELNTSQYNSPRIKIMIQDNTGIPVSISDEPKILVKDKTFQDYDIGPKEWEKIVLWIVLNKEILLKHWNKEISSVQFAREMQSVE